MGRYFMEKSVYLAGDYCKSQWPYKTLEQITQHHSNQADEVHMIISGYWFWYDKSSRRKLQLLSVKIESTLNLVTRWQRNSWPTICLIYLMTGCSIRSLPYQYTIEKHLFCHPVNASVRKMVGRLLSILLGSRLATKSPCRYHKSYICKIERISLPAFKFVAIQEEYRDLKWRVNKGESITTWLEC